MVGSIVDSNVVDSSSEDQFSSSEDQFSSVNAPNQYSSTKGINQQETREESRDGHLRNMIGWSVIKQIGRHGLEGFVDNYDSKTGKFRIVYENGKSEEICHFGLMKFLSPVPTEKMPPRRTRPLMMRAINAVPRQPRRAGRGMKRARTQNASAHQSGNSSAAREMPTPDSVNDKANKRARAQNAGGSKKRQEQHSSGNI